MYIKKLPEKFLENFGIYCKIYTMGQKIRLTERELTNLVKRIISEQTKTVSVSVDCTKQTVNGISVPALAKQLCKSGGAPTRTSGGAPTPGGHMD